MRPIIYQTLPRLFGAVSKENVRYGSIDQNGCGKMNDYTAKALKHIQGLGFNYIWYTGLIEHATKTDYSRYGIKADNPVVVKGNAGSPYAIKDYYDIDPDLAVDVKNRMKEFEALVSRTHRAGLKMIIDFVPNHVARQYGSDAKPMGVADLGENDDRETVFSPQNNFYYLPGQKLDISDIADEGAEYDEYPAKVTGNDCFTARPSKNDWYETVKLNYGINPQTRRFDDVIAEQLNIGRQSEGIRAYGHLENEIQQVGTQGKLFTYPSTWMKMLDILRYWATKGIDGFRCDMAEMVPVEFWEWAIPQIKSEHSNIIFIAEVYNPNEYRNYIYRGHFDYLYDKVGLYDTLRHVIGGGSASLITQCWQSVDDIQQHMLNFLENHDEQRIASPFFAGEPRRAYPALLVSALMHTNPFMVYQGQALGIDGMEDAGFSGSDGRTTIFDYWSTDAFCRWRNEDRFDGLKLRDRERESIDYYTRVLHIAATERAIIEGKTFDLMYANYENQAMDTNRLFAFLRKAKSGTVLVVANFADTEMWADVRIPAHAVDYLQLPTGIRTATDLLTGNTQTVEIYPDHIIPVHIPACDGLVLKF
ncbi:MAG: alpha-amylase [Bacteroidaceae bacterium]|nr:alpha-amylase [Bacteroidaceae bacterium]